MEMASQNAKNRHLPRTIDESPRVSSDDESKESDPVHTPEEEAKTAVSVYQTIDHFVIPLDIKTCLYCKKTACARVAVRIFIPGRNSFGRRNHYAHRQNRAIVPVCKQFFNEIVDAEYSELEETLPGKSVRQYIMLCSAGNCFRKYYLLTPKAIRYYCHLKYTRLSHRFDN